MRVKLIEPGGRIQAQWPSSGCSATQGNVGQIFAKAGHTSSCPCPFIMFKVGSNVNLALTSNKNTTEPAYVAQSLYTLINFA